MKFQKGKPRLANAGRRKGSKNKVRVLRVAEFLAEKGINPVEEILKLLPELRPAECARTWLDLLKYCEPQKREITLGESNPDHEPLSTEEKVALVQACSTNG